MGPLEDDFRWRRLHARKFKCASCHGEHQGLMSWGFGWPYFWNGEPAVLSNREFRLNQTGLWEDFCVVDDLHFFSFVAWCGFPFEDRPARPSSSDRGRLSLATISRSTSRTSFVPTSTGSARGSDGCRTSSRDIRTRSDSNATFSRETLAPGRLSNWSRPTTPWRVSNARG